MKLVTFEEKHGSFTYLYETQEEFYRICHKVVIDRKKEGWYEWFEDPEIESALLFDALNSDDLKDAHRFLLERIDYEYEYFYTHTPLRI